jgi:GNAT superfamily N-acetyltransferase
MKTDKPPGRTDAPRAIIYRPWQPDDSPEEVTALLHRAFAGLEHMGLHCASGHQPPAETLARLQHGRSFVAVDAGRIVGTISVYASEQDSSSHVYRDGKVASIHQFAVDPDYQGLGVGDALLRIAECTARTEGFTALALDTPKRAGKLRAFYLNMGFSVAESVQFRGRRYISLVLEKPLSEGTRAPPATAWI